MGCEKTALVALHLDGELAPFEGRALEAHAGTCRDCAQAYREQRRLAAALRDEVPRFVPPAGMDDRIRARIAAAAAVPRPIPLARRRWPALAASLLLTAALSSGVTWELARPRPAAGIAEEVVAGHVRSMMANHLTDVASSDRHSVKPWFNGRLALSPPVKDLTAQGYVLVGGRLDYLAGQPAAALVYRHRQHIINLYVVPASAGAAGPVADSVNGFNLARWTDGGLDFWAVSDLNRAELGQFEILVRAPD